MKSHKQTHCHLHRRHTRLTRCSGSALGDVSPSLVSRVTGACERGPLRMTRRVIWSIGQETCCRTDVRLPSLHTRLYIHSHSVYCVFLWHLCFLCRWDRGDARGGNLWESGGVYRPSQVNLAHTHLAVLMWFLQVFQSVCACACVQGRLSHRSEDH